MNLMQRLKRIESQIIGVPEELVFYHVGDPCFTLYGEEARVYMEQEQAAGRLNDPIDIDGYTLYLPVELR